MLHCEEEEVWLLIVSELLMADPAQTLVNKHASHMWSKVRLLFFSSLSLRVSSGLHPLSALLILRSRHLPARFSLLSPLSFVSLPSLLLCSLSSD